MICEHADVKRMLMTQKAFVEGAQALIFFCARLVDRTKISDEKTEKERLGLLLDLLTPIAKSWPSEYCLEANKLAIQVLGGYGYTRDYPVERLYRDNRLNHIHEGTWGIQALDLLGRKVRMHEGKALKIMSEEVNQTISKTLDKPELSEYGLQLRAAIKRVEDTVSAVVAVKHPSLGLANATLFLDAMGHAVVAWMWLEQGIAALSGLEKSTNVDENFYKGKLAAVTFFYRYELPKIDIKLDLVAGLDSTCYDLTSEQFIGI